ncbi:Tigger transposable element-derived protein 6 [Cucumispora dikerogammari]|nr:Tigger transposable element-derived protein 6 [Cucumispora dikerogammari]
MGVIFKTKCVEDSEDDKYNLNDTIYSTFSQLRNKNFPISRSILRTVALKSAERFSVTDFKTSSMWLSRFKDKYGIKFKILKGEFKSADTVAVEDFLKTVETLISRYKSDNIFNCDETALYYKLMSRKSFVYLDDNCKDVKVSKERVTLLLCCSLACEKQKPLIIVKSKSPRSLKNVDLNFINVEYYSSYNAWITKSIFRT